MVQSYHWRQFTLEHAAQHLPVELHGILIPNIWFGLDAAPLDR